MKRILLMVILLCGITSFAEAKTYVILDKETGVIQGTADISDDAILEWTKKYIVKEAGEDFRGKKPHEIKYENKKLKLATEKEVADYKTAKETEIKEARKQKALNDLGITQAELDKIKNLKE